ncbi:ubiquinone biosynthesis protein COQ4 [Patiriisocius marinistellae]|nr:ubiquinone biosynthesis protein COQ4 [Patiriisocius marinistellae]
MSSDTFGYHLGSFLKERNFHLIPKVERHDAYHVLTGYGTNVEDEIALQYCCFGNGKRTPYLYGVLLLGTLILPDYLRYYLSSYRFGKQINSFHHYDYKAVLSLNFKNFRSIIISERTLIKPYLNTLNYEKQS